MEIKRPVIISKAFRFDFRSEVNQRSYSISVAPPLVALPEKGCPVLYVLDGDWYFGTAVEAVRNNAPTVAVVGIGYPDDEVFIEEALARHQPLPEWAKDEPAFRAVVGLERMYDLGLPMTEEVIAREFPKNSGVAARDVGGLDDFLEVLQGEIKPRVAASVPVDPSNQALFGHSLGGLAVVHALFVEPSAFRTFIAASPSIWWNDKAVLGGEAKFAQAVREGRVSPRVLITMGSEEDKADPAIAARASLEFEEYAAHVQRVRMVENARELTKRLQALQGSADFEVEEYAVFPKQDHGISPWPALGRAVSFAFPP
jgi:ferri-bacillibactin esterase